MRRRVALWTLALLPAAGMMGGQPAKVDTDSAGPVNREITDGVNRFEINSYGTADGALTDYEVPTGTDHQFANWWWYRVAGDTRETRLPPPDSEDFTGDVATLGWTDVDGRGLFDANLRITIAVDGDGSTLLHDLTISNRTGATLSLALFHYVDLDLDVSAGNDTAIEVLPSVIEISEVSTARFFGAGLIERPAGTSSPGSTFLMAVGQPSYRVDVFSAVRDSLNDDVVDQFADTGLPFGPDDFTGAFQYSLGVAGGGDGTIFSDLCVNSCSGPLIFADGFETGDTESWSNTVD